MLFVKSVDVGFDFTGSFPFPWVDPDPRLKEIVAVFYSNLCTKTIQIGLGIRLVTTHQRYAQPHIHNPYNNSEPAG